MMKKIMKLSLIVIGALAMMSLLPGPGKCTGDSEYAEGIKKLGSFKLIKDYRISLRKSSASSPEEIVTPVSLTKGLKYKFLPVDNDENEGKLVMTLYMKRGKQMKIASTMSAAGKHYPSIEFQSGKTGTFYLHMYFTEGHKGCAVGLFAVSH